MFNAWITLAVFWMFMFILDLFAKTFILGAFHDFNFAILCLLIEFQYKEIKKLKERLNGDN